MGQASSASHCQGPRVPVSRWRGFGVVWISALCVMVPVFIGCTGSRETVPLEFETGAAGEPTHDGLVRTHGSALEGVWAKPDADIAKYDQLLIGEVRMAYKRKPDGRRYSSTGTNFALSANQVERMEALFRKTFEEEIQESESWTLATEPGEDVLLVEPGLMDLVVRVPTDSPPRSMTFSTSAGAVTLVLELRDSLTHEILARVADRSEARSPGSGANQLTWSNSVTNTSAVRTIFRRWARIFMARLDTARRLRPTEPLESGDDAILDSPAGAAEG